MGAVFLGEHPLRVRLTVHDPKKVHRAVADVAEHIHAAEIPELFCNGSEALRINLRTGKMW